MDYPQHCENPNPTGTIPQDVCAYIDTSEPFPVATSSRCLLILTNAQVKVSDDVRHIHCQIDTALICHEPDMRRPSALRVMDVFAGGVGGWSHAVRHLEDLQAPISTVACIDNSVSAAETHMRIHGGIHLQENQLPAASGSMEVGPVSTLALLHCHTHANFWTVSCPCPPWSRAGGQSGFQTESGRLWLDVFEAALLCRPAMIAVENVSTITEHPDFHHIRKTAAWAGFRFLWEDTASLEEHVPASRPRWLALFGVQWGQDEELISYRWTALGKPTLVKL